MLVSCNGNIRLWIKTWRDTALVVTEKLVLLSFIYSILRISQIVSNVRNVNQKKQYLRITKSKYGILTS